MLRPDTSEKVWACANLDSPAFEFGQGLYHLQAPQEAYQAPFEPLPLGGTVNLGCVWWFSGEMFMPSVYAGDALNLKPQAKM